MLHAGLAAPDGFGIYRHFLGAPGAWPGPAPTQTGRAWHLARGPGWAGGSKQENCALVSMEHGPF